MELASGHKVQYLDDEVQQQYNKDFPGIWNDVVKLEPDGWILPKKYLEIENKIYGFKFRPEDVVVMTYPKSGTTWAQEIVWTMRKNPDLDHPDADDSLYVRSPYIEMDMLLPSVMPMEQKQTLAVLLKGQTKYGQESDYENGVIFTLAESGCHEGGRIFKTHLPFSLLPKNLLDTCKVVHVIRNPKDQLLSTQHHYKISPNHGFAGTLDTFLDYHVRNLLLYGSYPIHLREVWGRRGHPNLHTIFYEDLKADIAGQITELDKFLGTNLTPQQMNNVIRKTSFDAMKKNNPLKTKFSRPLNKGAVDKDGSFFRKGEAGAWRGQYTPEQEAKLDAWIRGNFQELEGIFKYD